MSNKGIVFCFLCLCVSCNYATSNEKTITLEVPAFTKEGDLTLFKSDGKSIRTIDIEIADTDIDREVGLMDRDHLAIHQGMLFIMDDERIQTFHMKNTLIPLDLVFIDSDKKIVSFIENAKPMDRSLLSSQVPAKYVLEINAGMAQDWLLEVGDYVSWEVNTPLQY